MNLRVHNPEVAGIQIATHEFETRFINGERHVGDLNDFNTLYQELKKIIQDYKKLYLEAREESTRKEYDTFLAQEIDFLNLMNEIMSNLENYHDVVGFVEGREIKKEMDHARTIILYRNIERQIAILRRMKGNMPDSYKEQYKTLLVHYKKLRKEVIEAEAYIIEKSSTEYNTMEVTTSSDRKKNYYTIDQEFYNKLPLITDKCKYIELIINNIEKVKGKKSFVTYCGVTKEISTKHVWRYRQYISLLTNLYKKYEREEKDLIKQENERSNTDVCASQYASIIIALYKLGFEALPLINHPDRVMTVTSIDGLELTILKSRLEKFEELIGKYEDLKKMTPYLDENSELMLVQNIEKYQKLPERKREIFNRIRFFEHQEESEKILEKINQLKKELYELYMAEKFVIFANMKAIFKTSGLPEQMSVFYTNIMGNISGFSVSSKYTDEEKLQVLTDILLKLEEFEKRKEENKINLSLPLIIENSSNFLKKIMVNVKQIISALPGKNKQHVKIIKIRKGKNKNDLLERIKEQSGYIAASIGMTVFAGLSSFVSSYEINKNMVPKKEEKTSFKEETNEMDEVIEKIYQRVEETKESGGIVTYDYNGILLELDSNAPDFKDKKMALERNGAIEIKQEIGGRAA
ncbi:MAG: hypothetical protein HFJ02_02955 [Bacilli bacterium]|nr:hypothetical protein [Bacilli bacterium]